MVQEGEDGGGARVGAGGQWGLDSGNILWCLIPSANLLSVLGTLKVMWGLLSPFPCPTRTGCGANLHLGISTLTLK